MTWHDTINNCHSSVLLYVSLSRENFYEYKDVRAYQISILRSNVLLNEYNASAVPDVPDIEYMNLRHDHALVCALGHMHKNFEDR